MSKFVSQHVTEQFCIYWNPKDYPGMFVTRRYSLDADNIPVPDLDCTLATTLDEARKDVPKGFVRLGRDERDDASIVEVWI